MRERLLNPWREIALKRAERLFEDSDRATFAARLFTQTIRRVHHLTVAGAHDTPDPFLERTVLEDGVLLEFGWHDRGSGWHLYVSVKRTYGEKPRVVLDFSGNPEHYGADNPTDADISVALQDYFEKWKNDP